jgi:transcription elongation factor GreA
LFLNCNLKDHVLGGKMEHGIIITKKGFEKLREELKHYQSEKRYEAIEAIKTSRSMSGEMAENAEYQEALAEQDRIEKHINILKDKVDNAKVIDVSLISNLEVVSFGVTVTLMDLDTDKEIVFQIVGIEETDVAKGRISYQSPIAKEALGKRVGDIIDVEVPAGDRELEIIKIEIKE